MRQIPLPIGPLPAPDFDSFVAGANAAALAHLLALDEPAAPVYLWGPAGSGKTHLLRATADRARSAGRTVAWFDAGDAPPWALPADATLAVIDRCEALDDDAQHAAFTVFVDAVTQGTQVLAAGRLPPVDLLVRDDLRTRLGWGPVFALKPLAEDETRAVLRRDAQRRGIVLSDDVVNHLLTRFDRDLSHLTRLLDRLDRYALAQSRQVTVPLLRRMLADEDDAGEGAGDGARAAGGQVAPDRRDDVDGDPLRVDGAATAVQTR